MKTEDILKIIKTTRTQVLEKRAKVNLPKPTAKDLDDDDDYEPIGLDGVLASTEKLLSVNRGLIPPDERDSQNYKRVFTTDRLLRERVKLDADKIRFNLARRLSKTRNLKPVHSFIMNPYMEGQLLGNPLSMPLEEINPLQLVEQSRRMTQMGPGGLGSSQAITPEAQNIHPSEFGFISGLEGPESERAGIDTRLTWGTKVGDDGRLYHRLYDRRLKKHRYVSPQDLAGSTIAFPD